MSWPTLIPSRFSSDPCKISSFEGLKVVKNEVHVLVERTGSEGCKTKWEPFAEFLKGKHIEPEKTIVLLKERLALMAIEGIKAEITITTDLKDLFEKNLETAIYMGIGDKSETKSELKGLLNLTIRGIDSEIKRQGKNIPNKKKLKLKSFLETNIHLAFNLGGYI